jgi:hypothetical protein
MISRLIVSFKRASAIGHGLMLSLSIAKWQDLLNSQSLVYESDRLTPTDLSNLLPRGTDLDPNTWLTRHELRLAFLRRKANALNIQPNMFPQGINTFLQDPTNLGYEQVLANVHIVCSLWYSEDISQALEKPSRNFTRVGDAPTWKILVNHVGSYKTYTPFLNGRSFILR